MSQSAECTVHEAAWQGWQPRNLVWLLLRCGVVATAVAVGFGCLAYFHHAEWLPAGKMQVYDNTFPYAYNVAIACIYPLLCMAVLTELQISLLLSCKWSWRMCQIVLPIMVACVGAYFVLLLFPQGERGPKETMLVAGGALFLHLAAGLHLSLWREMTRAHHVEADLPAPYYVVMVLLLATFVGGMKGATNDNPYLRRVIDYQKDQIAKGAYQPDLKENPVEPGI